MTLEDLSKYETTIHDTPLETESLPGDLVVCGPPPPSSFAVSAAIINIMAEYYKNESIIDLNDPLIVSNVRTCNTDSQAAPTYRTF